MKNTKKLGEYEDWEACDSTLQIGRLFVFTRISKISTIRPPSWRAEDKQEKQAKKDYFEASDSVS